MRIGFERVLWGALGSLLVFCLTVAATPGMGFLFNNFTRSTYVGHMIHEGANLPGWNLRLDVEGATDFVQQDVELAPGGFSGWHSHPGPVLITVKSGTATFYNADDSTCSPVVYPAGSAYIEPAGASHNVFNRGMTNLELLDTYLVPQGMPTRQEQNQPFQCPF